MKKYWVMGDIHGDYLPVKDFYIKHKDELSQDPRDNILILLGDVGANYFFNERDSRFKKNLEKLPFSYFCIRGNHEQRPSIIYNQNPQEWHTDIQFNNVVYVENKYDRIYYALDAGGIYWIDNKKVLVLPGAYSVDKDYRLKIGWSWFPEEQMSLDEFTWILGISADRHFDMVLSHTCPLSWQTYISDLFLNQVDQSKVDNHMEQKLEAISHKITWDRWYFGHYHSDRDIPAEKATMLFHQVLPFGVSISEYNSMLFDFS